MESPNSHVSTARLSRTLDSVFRIQSDVDGVENPRSAATPATDLDLGWLTDSIAEKQRAVTTRAQELAEIESRLRETEQRLALAARSNNLPSRTEQSNDHKPVIRSQEQSQQIEQQTQASQFGGPPNDRASMYSTASVTSSHNVSDQALGQGQHASSNTYTGSPRTSSLPRSQESGLSVAADEKDQARPDMVRNESLGLPNMPGALPPPTPVGERA